MKCFYCDKEINSETDLLFFFAFDKPYVNIPVHRPECFLLIQNKGISEYFEENKEKVYSYFEGTGRSLTKKKETKRK